jgi:hypothetical protein
MPTASDADGDTLTFSASGTPAWAMLNASTGELGGTPSNLDAGPHGPIVISVSDGTVSSSLAAFSIDVPAPFELLSSELGTAGIDDVEIAFVDNGDGIAIWRIDTGASEELGSTLQYSAYTAATQSWSASQELITVAPPRRVQFVLAGGANSIGVLFAVEQDGPTDQLFGTTFSNGQFATPELLDETTSRYLSIYSFTIVSSGAGYAAAWQRDETFDPATFARERTIRAVQLSAVGAAWETAQTVSVQGDVFRPSLAGNGSSYLLAWRQDSSVAGELMVTNSVGPGWNATPTLAGTATQSTTPLLASNGSDYQLIWIGDDGGVSSILGTNFSSSFVQSAVMPLEASATPAYGPNLVSNGSDYLVTWQQQAASLFAAVGSTTAGFSTPAEIDTGINSISSVSLASNGAEYAVVWRQYEVPVHRAWANLYDGAWQTALRLDTGSESIETLRVAATAAGFAAYYTQRPAATENADLFGHAFDAATWGAGAPALLETGADVPTLYASAGNGTNAFAVWRQYPDDGSAEQVYAVRSGAPFTAAQALVTTPLGSTAQPIHLLSNDAGMALAIWSQQDGSSRETYASVKDAGGVWGAPVALGMSTVQSGSVLANDTGFAVIGLAGGFSDENYDVIARVFDGQSWSAITALDGAMTGTAQWPAIASDGTGFMAAWVQSPTFPANDRRAWASLYENGAWGVPVQIDDGTAFVQVLKVASNGTGYAATWNNLATTAPVNIYDGVAWSGHTTVATDDVNASPDIVSDGTGYMLYWDDEGAGDTEFNVYASISPTAAVVDFTTVRVSDDAVSVSSMYGASDGTGYALVWNERTTPFGDGVIASTWNGTAWSAPQSLETNSFTTSLSGMVANPTAGGYAVAWEAWDDAGNNASTLTVNVHDGATWLGEQVIETSDAIFDAHVSGGLAASDGTYGIAWVQEDDSGSGLAHVHYGTFDGTSWSDTQLEGQAGAADDALIAGDGDTFTVFWRQADPAGHAAVQLPYAYTDLP